MKKYALMLIVLLGILWFDWLLGMLVKWSFVDAPPAR